MRAAWLWVVVLVVMPNVVHADDRAQAREHFVKGTKAFELGLYDEAITEYMAAYKAKDDPALLYNIAQAHRLAGHAAEALRFYRVYASKLPNAANRSEVQTKIEELQKLVDQQKRTQNLPPDAVIDKNGKPVDRPVDKPVEKTVERPADRPVDPAPTSSPPAEKPPEPPPAVTAAPKPGRTKIVAGLAVAGVGVAALITGIALSVVAQQTSDELTALDQAGGAFDAGKHSTGETLGTVGPVMLGIGGAATVAGVVVAVLGFRESKSARVAVTPLLSPTTAGMTLGGRF
jgi:hypothetical protein